MLVSDLSDLFTYTEWANAALLDAAAGLTPDDWTRPLGGSFPTLQDLLGHVVGSEWIWLARWTSEGPSERPAWAAAASPSDLRARLDEVEQGRRRYLAALSDVGLTANRPYTMLNGDAANDPLGMQMLHTVNHSTYHRGQAAAMLRMLGVTPPSTDLIAWVRTGGSRRESPDSAQVG